MTAPLRDLLARVVAGDPSAAVDLGIRLAQRRPLPPVTEEPCEDCLGEGSGPTIPNRYGPDYATRCETCHGDGKRWVCEGCGGFRGATGAGGCRC